ncbi:ATP-binding cassette domain-containing protein [Xylophilus rhododendri]|uniref:ATP-binding cassette domain-containing protein n=1 Tax=Xylophilus rhododendri TaxID=2697032 RepID=A0A857IYB9_9BURK|nr:ATP-binding cassette domain-containing protein [Xylophilus rhododendri]QHI96540.1 ATP-binding cassette domain-containing protein [Xylophilus rhododendri]
MSRSSHALELRGVEKRFGASEILRGIDLAVRPQECVAVIGPNGAGKSTLFDTISGRHAPSAGSILLQGQSIAGWAPQRLRRRGLSRSFQTTQLFGSLDVRNHLRCALAAVAMHPLRWLLPFERTVSVEQEVDRLLHTIGLQGLDRRPAATLSYAEQRLLEVGLAFCGDPAVVLLDEPTAGMSQDETARCIAVIRQLAAGRTVLMVEHDMQVVFELAGRVAVLADGRVIAFDSPQQVRADPAVRLAYGGL